MKFRTDFVTNSSSSSFVTILATEYNGIRKRLELTTDVDGFDATVDLIDFSNVTSGNELLETLKQAINYDEEDSDTWLAEIRDIHTLKSLEIRQTMEIDDYKHRVSVALIGKAEETPTRKDTEKTFSIDKYNMKETDLLRGVDFYGYEDSMIKITGCKRPSGEIVVPDYVAKSRVVEIGSKAFGGLSGILSVFIPDGVLIIGDDAFANCSDLETVRIPEGIIYIGKRAFAGCPKLKRPAIPSGTKVAADAFEAESAVTAKTYERNEAQADELEKYKQMFKLRVNKKEIVILDAKPNVKELVFPETIGGSPVRLDDDGIRNNPYIEKIVWPSYDAGIFAFSNCKNLKEVIIPETMTHFHGYELSDTPFWNSFPGLVVINHIALGYNGREGRVVVPPDVHTIACNFFMRSPALCEIILPSTVTQLEGDAFHYEWMDAPTRTLDIIIPDGHFTMKGLEGLKSCSKTTMIHAPAGTKTEQFALKNGLKFEAI